MGGGGVSAVMKKTICRAVDGAKVLLHLTARPKSLITQEQNKQPTQPTVTLEVLVFGNVSFHIGCILLYLHFIE